MREVFCCLIFLLAACPCHAATYSVTPAHTTVDGDTFCGGGVCQPDDVLIVESGSRDSIMFRDLRGSDGHPIVILNESAGQARFINSGVNSGVVAFYACSWVTMRGDNAPGVKYGFYVDNDASLYSARAFQLYYWGDCDHMKLFYVELTSSNNTSNSGIGVRVGGLISETTAITYDDYELAYLYVHDSPGSGFYLGNNNPATNDDPWISNVDVHDCIISGVGATGITHKGQNGGTSEIYRNLIVPGPGDAYSVGANLAYPVNERGGMRTLDCVNGAVTKYYGNYIEKAYWNGILFADNSGWNQAYNNVIAGCGGGGANAEESSGIAVAYMEGPSSITGNIIIQPYGYGIYQARESSYTDVTTYSGNMIADAGLGAAAAVLPTKLVDNGGNVYSASVASLGLGKWSNDGDYSNDFLMPISASGTASGILVCSAGSRDVTNTITTPIAANARIGDTDAGNWAAMAAEMDVTDGVTHTNTESRACGASYVEYIRVADYFRTTGMISAGHESDAIVVSYATESVATPSVPAGRGFLKTLAGNHIKLLSGDHLFHHARVVEIGGGEAHETVSGYIAGGVYSLGDILSLTSSIVDSADITMNGGAGHDAMHVDGNGFSWACDPCDFGGDNWSFYDLIIDGSYEVTGDNVRFNRHGATP